jgi:hypothetical protein
MVAGKAKLHFCPKALHFEFGIGEADELGVEVANLVFLAYSLVDEVRLYSLQGPSGRHQEEASLLGSLDPQSAAGLLVVELVEEWK